MPEYLAPGVYVEEVPFHAHPIEGVSTITAGLVRVTVAKVRKRRSKCRVILTERIRKRRLCIARALAHELRRNLYRIDLEAVRSKYIGETEKNLRRLFSRAQKNDVVLFFDEADALFGKRSDVEDADNRYARFDPRWFLEQLEAFRGIALLAVRRNANVDAAFVRRFRCIFAPSRTEEPPK